MRKNCLTIIALIAVFAMILAGCGSEKTPETTTAAATTAEAVSAQPLGLASFSLSTTTWSSPDGATVNLTAAPSAHEEGQSAMFIVRLEGEEIAIVPCQWDGKNYTASAELNAADGYCYYVSMTAADGSTAEIPVNTPAEPTDEALINMAASLNAYCSVMVESSAFESGKLTVSAGTVQVQAPKITNNGETITVSEAVLVLSFNGEEVDRQALALTEGDTAGSYEAALSQLAFRIPDMENDQQLILTLNVTLSNGQSLSAPGGTFFYNDGELLTAVG